MGRQCRGGAETAGPPRMTREDIRILSAGAPKLGVSRCTELFTDRTGLTVGLEFATAPVVRERVEGGAADADIVVAPVGDIARFAADGWTVADSDVAIGSVKAGIAVHERTAPPDIGSVEAMETALLAADAVVFNEASSGRYIAEMLQRLGLAERLAGKTVRVPNGAAVIDYLTAHPESNAIGFGQVPEIRRFVGKGVQLVGPLPEPVARTTSYAAALLNDAASPDAARDLLRFIAAPDARPVLEAAGLD